MMSDLVGVSLVTQQTSDKDELFICPFDPVHRISAKRFVYHVVKCRKQHPHLETATCPFNARHIILKPELRHHTSICPDKKLLELELHSCDVTELSNDQRVVSNEELDFDDDEDWNAEIECNRHLNPIDPFASNNVGFTAPKTQSAFSENAGAKKVNSRREAIKKIKERVRQQAKDNDELTLRRPYFDVIDHDNLHPVFAKSHRQPLQNSIPNSRSCLNGDAGIMNMKKLAVQTKSRPRLAPNFNMEPKPTSYAIGRGRFFQEMHSSGEKINRRPGALDPLHDSSANQPTLISLDSSQERQFRVLQEENYEPGTNSLASALTAHISANNDTECGEIALGGDVDWGQDELEKKERKLTKLLKQIDVLERRLASGGVLNAEQHSKVNRKQEILKSLQMTKQQMITSS